MEEEGRLCCPRLLSDVSHTTSEQVCRSCFSSVLPVTFADDPYEKTREMAIPVDWVEPELGDISMRSGYDVWLCTSFGCHAGGSIEEKKDQKSLVANRACKRRDRKRCVEEKVGFLVFKHISCIAWVES